MVVIVLFCLVGLVLIPVLDAALRRQPRIRGPRAGPETAWTVPAPITGGSLRGSPRTLTREEVLGVGDGAFEPRCDRYPRLVPHYRRASPNAKATDRMMEARNVGFRRPQRQLDDGTDRDAEPCRANRKAEGSSPELVCDRAGSSLP